MKLGGWLVMLTAMVMFFTFIGIGLPTGLNSILEKVGIDINQTSLELVSADIESSTFWDEIFGSTGILIAVLASTVIIGFFAKGYDPSLVLLPLVIFLAGVYISVFWGIIKFVATYNQWWFTSIITIVFGALAVGFIISCVDYFAGR